MISTKECPCKHCVAPKRQYGCHAVCEDYRDWSVQDKCEKDRIRKVRDGELQDLVPMKIKRRRMV